MTSSKHEPLSPNFKLSELNAKLLVLKDDLRRVQTAIKDVLLCIANPGEIIRREEYQELLEPLHNRVSLLEDEISVLESERRALKQAFQV